MSYPVQVVIEEDNLAVRLGEIQEWLKRHCIETGAFTYRMDASRVRLRIDFTRLRDATQFARDFSGLVLGAIPAT